MAKPREEADALMKNYSHMWKLGSIVAAFVMASSSVAESNQMMAYTGVSQAATVHKVTHGLAEAVNYSKARGYKWSQTNFARDEAVAEWTGTEQQNAGYKWASRVQAVDSQPESAPILVSETKFVWSANSLAEEAGFKWGFRSYADQAGFKWGFRSYADQAGFKWGFRSYADQAGFKWGFRSYADQAGFKWGFR